MKIFDPVGFSSKLTGSFSGSFVGDGSEITGIISSSYAVTASYAHNALSSSYAISASNALTASHGENFVISGSFNIGDYTWPTTDGTYGVEVLTTDKNGICIV